MVYSEMVSAKGLYYDSAKTEELLKTYPQEQPIIFQIFGSEEWVMEYAAQYLEDYPNIGLDLNMGCPVPKVVKNGEGSALMKDPKKAASLVKTLVANTQKAVTVKIRSGWNSSSLNAVEVAKYLEDAGASAIGVHGRTREQYYGGKADWGQITKVKEAVSVPVFGSGDVFSAFDAMRMIEETACDGVMIARGALGNPWIFKQALALWKGEVEEKDIENLIPSHGEKLDMLERHFKMLVCEKGEMCAVREIRKFASYYLKGFPQASVFRNRVNKVMTSDQFHLELSGFR